MRIPIEREIDGEQHNAKHWTSLVQGDTPALDGGVQLCVVGEAQAVWKNCERLLNTSLQFIHLVLVALLLRRF